MQEQRIQCKRKFHTSLENHRQMIDHATHDETLSDQNNLFSQYKSELRRMSSLIASKKEQNVNYGFHLTIGDVVFWTCDYQYKLKRSHSTKCFAFHCGAGMAIRKLLPLFFVGSVRDHLNKRTCRKPTIERTPTIGDRLLTPAIIDRLKDL